MTQKKKAPSEFDSAIESYVLDQMEQRGGAALTSEDLSDFVKKCVQKFFESTLKGELNYHLKNNVLDVKNLKKPSPIKKNNHQINETGQQRKPSLPIWEKSISKFPETGIQHLNPSVFLSENVESKALTTRSSACMPVA